MVQPTPLFLRTVALIKAIPEGKVLSYGQVAELISAPGCARHVSYILSSSSKKYQLPWHRVLSSSGKIATHSSSFKQMKLLAKEGVGIEKGALDLKEYSWKPSRKEVNQILKGLPRHTSIFLRK